MNRGGDGEEGFAPMLAIQAWLSFPVFVGNKSFGMVIALASLEPLEKSAKKVGDGEILRESARVCISMASERLDAMKNSLARSTPALEEKANILEY